MKITKTNLELISFANVAAEYLEKNLDKKTGKGNMLCTSIKSVMKEVTPILEAYNEDAENLRLDSCSVDEKTKVILSGTDGGYVYSVEGKKKINAAIKELLKKEIEINQRVREQNDASVDTLTPLEREVFGDIVITKQTEDED